MKFHTFLVTLQNSKNTTQKQEIKGPKFSKNEKVWLQLSLKKLI